MTVHRSSALAASTAVLLATSLLAGGTARAEGHGGQEGDSGVAPLVTWNQAMVSGLDQAGIGGPPATRIAAIVEASVFDAVNGVERHYTPYFETAHAPRHTSAAAAAIGAAHEALVRLVPAQQATYDALRQTTVAKLHHSRAAAVARGLAWGAKVADDITAWRGSDGMTTPPPPYQSTPLPGRWQPTAPGFGPPTFRQFATMVPFTMTSPSQFLPPPPPALTSRRYARDVNETKAYGSLTSTVRSAYGTESALLWAAGSPTALWNPVADTLIGEHHLSLSEAARLLARMNLASGDAAIAVWNAKSRYDTWRPITAIQHADTDGNAATAADPNWQPLRDTPPFQEYPSGHVGASSAAAEVLAGEFGNHADVRISTTFLPGVVHTFGSFSAALAEVTQARIDIGFHFRFACNTAAAMGHRIAAWIAATQMRPVRHDRH